MKVVADSAIPGIDELFSSQFDVHKLDTSQINANNLQLLHADILICRSVTTVNAALLEGTPITLVASTTSGIDHIDVNYLKLKGISFCAAAGSNAPAVRDYIVSVLAVLHRNQLIAGKRAGVIGIGHIGSKVRYLLHSLGFDVVVNDPPRAATEEHFFSTSLQHFQDLDLISINAAHNLEPPHANFHLLEKKFFTSLKPGCVIINTARGSIINTEDVLNYGKHLTLCFDVFEQEPNINYQLLQQCIIATPHIAGHSIESKARASWLIYNKIREIYHLSVSKDALDYFESATKQLHEIPNTADKWYDNILQLYDPLIETRILQQQSPHTVASCFMKLRALHNKRHEFDVVQPYKNEHDSDGF